MKKKIRTIVFPVGGLGTRFLPATKATPKEMLPVAEKPLIQYAFEEAMEAGIEKFIFVTGRNKGSIEDHFDNMYELQSILSEKKKAEMLEKTIGWLPKPGQIVFLRQQHPLGLGHAVLCAEKFVGDEPFAVSLADEMVYEDNNYLSRMIDLYNNVETEKANILGIDEVAKLEDVKKYGIVDPINENAVFTGVKGMVEKPEPEKAPSKLSIIGRYILEPEIFDCIRQTESGAGGEIQLTDAMKILLRKQAFYGLKFSGERFDCGSILGYLDANIHYAMKNARITEDVKKIISKYVK